MTRDRNEQKLLQRELKNPQKQLNYVFLLTGVIPLLTCFYLVLVPQSREMSPPQLAQILLYANVILLLGYIVGYKAVRSVLSKVMGYASRARRSDEMRAQLAATLAHDLKSPLAIIKANMANLRAGFLGPLDPRQKEMADLCTGVADRTAAILTDLINTYSPGATERTPEVSRFDLGELAKEQFREIEVIARGKDLGMKGMAWATPLWIEADRALIARAIHNLLSNAVKFTPAGGKITLHTLQDEGFAELEVSNTGPVIPDETLEKIFENYERLDSGQEGQGLGLAITRTIIESYHGKVWAESGPGEPNRFILLLPLTR